MSSFDISEGGERGDLGADMSSAMGGGLGKRGELEGDLAAAGTAAAAMLVA